MSIHDKIMTKNELKFKKTFYFKIKLIKQIKIQNPDKKRGAGF